MQFSGKRGFRRFDGIVKQHSKVKIPYIGNVVLCNSSLSSIRSCDICVQPNAPRGITKVACTLWEVV